jgi:enoyl-CoA hydratase/carnithine racemase
MTWVARIAIDRPERMNAFDIDTHEEFDAAIDRVENEDDDIRIAAITGTGERAFSSGRDLKWTAQVRRASDEARADVDRRMAALMRLQFRHDITKPLLARVNGVALGGGLEFALACDIIVAADHVEMCLPEARRALIAGAMGIHRLPRQLPHHLAMGFPLTGRHFSAQKAVELGLVNQVTPMEELDSAVDSWIAGIIRCSPAAIRATKESALNALHLSLADAGQYRGPMESAWPTSSDRIEGPRAFADKRNLDCS